QPRPTDFALHEAGRRHCLGRPIRNVQLRPVESFVVGAETHDNVAMAIGLQQLETAAIVNDMKALDVTRKRYLEKVGADTATIRPAKGVGYRWPRNRIEDETGFLGAQLCIACTTGHEKHANECPQPMIG